MFFLKKRWPLIFDFLPVFGTHLYFWKEGGVAGSGLEQKMVVASGCCLQVQINEKKIFPLFCGHLGFYQKYKIAFIIKGPRWRFVVNFQPSGCL